MGMAAATATTDTTIDYPALRSILISMRWTVNFPWFCINVIKQEITTRYIFLSTSFAFGIKIVITMLSGNTV